MIAVAVDVLKAQAADADPEVARCLMRGALEPIHAQTEKLQALAQEFEPRRR